MKFDIKAMFHACKMGLKKHSPEILIFLGIGGTVGGAIVACKATRKLDDILDTHKKNVDAVHEAYDVVPEDNDAKRELTKVYLSTGFEIAKLYAPSVTIGLLSITSILAGNNILRKRNLALAAAYTAIDTSYKQYRSRVVERYGEDVDRELHIGGHQEQIEVIETDEDGKETKVEKSVTVVDNALPSDYARYFCYGEALAAEPNDDYNSFFLRGQQNRANVLLTTRGYLFLNDVYDMLGYERSVAGQSVGWVYDRNGEGPGDNYVDFGIQEVYRKNSDVPGDYEKVYLLDFNVDGNILNHSLNKGLITQ